MNQIPIRLLTHNIRYATKSPSEGEEPWSVRCPRAIAELRFNTAHCSASFICLQEVLHEQLLDLLRGLNEGRNEWDYIGVGRDDGDKAGEYSPILYQPQTWAVQSYETIWLSETPDRPSKGWDAASIRILTVGQFQHRQSKKTVVAMNTHLDNQGHQSRLEGAKMILEHIAHFLSQTDSPTAPAIFLTGDFNSEPNQEAHQILNSDESPMCDLQSLVPAPKRYGEQNTFTGFGHERSPPTTLDFLFINHPKPSSSTKGSSSQEQPSSWSIDGYSILANRFEDGVYSSDHRAVVGDVRIN